MHSNSRNELRSGQPRSLVVVRPATLRGTISAASNLAWLTISSLGTEILYIIALVIGALVGLSQGLFRVSIEVAKSPFTSPSKKTIGGDGNISGSREPSHEAAAPVGNILPRNLFVEPYDGVVDEQRGTEMHTPDDLVGPGTVEEVMMPTKEQEISTEIQRPAPAVAEKESEKMEAVEPIAVVLPSVAKHETSEHVKDSVQLTTTSRAPVVVEKVASPIESIAPEPLIETGQVALPSKTSSPFVDTDAPPAITSTATPVIQEMASFGEPEPVITPPSSTLIEEEKYTTAAELEGNALITKSARRSDQPSPQKVSSDAPDTPKVPSTRGVAAESSNASEETPSLASGSTNATTPAEAAAPTITTAAPAAALPTEPETEPAIAALPNAKPTVVDKDILPAVVLEGEEQKGIHAKKKNKRGFIRGPLHKAAKEIRKAFH